MGRDWLLQADRRLRDLDAIPSAELPTWLERLLRAAIARRPLEATSTTELLVDSAINVLTAPEPLEPDVLGYLHATQLLRDGQTTNLGRVLLRLEGRDAVRWLLVTELIQSTGPGDPHRLSQATAELLLARPEDTVWDGRHEDESPEFPHAWSTFERFESLNLLWTNPDPLVRGYRLWPEGAAILREVSSSDFPMRAVAGALLEQDAPGFASCTPWLTSSAMREGTRAPNSRRGSRSRPSVEPGLSASSSMTTGPGSRGNCGTASSRRASAPIRRGRAKVSRC
jgi:hypothetical protein